jgi:hypothetical protein
MGSGHDFLSPIRNLNCDAHLCLPSTMLASSSAIAASERMISHVIVCVYNAYR